MCKGLLILCLGSSHGGFFVCEGEELVCFWLMGVVKTTCGLVPLVPVGASDRGIILHCIFLFFGGFICFLFGCLLSLTPFVYLFCLFPFSLWSFYEML